MVESHRLKVVVFTFNENFKSNDRNAKFSPSFRSNSGDDEYKNFGSTWKGSEKEWYKAN